MRIYLWLKMLILLTGIGVFWAFSESFLATEKAQKPRSVSQIKQDIVEIMGVLLDLDSKAIETNAKIQRGLYKHIKAYADGEKNAFFTCSTPARLQHILKQLREEKARNERSQSERERFLALVSSPMIA